MEQLLDDTKKLTPRLLMELYLHPKNLERTLAQSAFDYFMDDIKQKTKRITTEKAHSNDYQPSTMNKVEKTFKNRFHSESIVTDEHFIEFLNILNDKLLGSSGYDKMRTEWRDNVSNFSGVITRGLDRVVRKQLQMDGDTPFEKHEMEMFEYNFVIRELMMWAVVSNRREKLDLIIQKAARKTFGGNDGELGDDEQKVEHFEPLKYYIQAAVMARKSMELCDEVVLSGVKKLYNQMADDYEEKSVNLITEIAKTNGEFALIGIRQRMPNLSNRSILDLAFFGDLQKVMATDTVQELVTKIWYGGIEPEGRWGPLIAAWLLPPIAPLMLPSANDIHVDYDAPVFSWSTLKKNKTEPSKKTDTRQLSYFKKLAIFMTAPVTTFFYNILIFFGFLAFFIWVLMRKFCLKPQWQEYIVIVTLFATCLERARKFIAMRNCTARQKFFGLLSDGYNWIYMIALVFSIIGVIFRYMAFNAIPEEEKIRLYGADSTATESDLCPPVILNNEIYDTELKEEGYFEVNVLVKWAHLCYMIAFFMMFVSALQFYALNSLLGPLTIAIGEMIKDFIVFLGILLIFVVPFGIIMMSLLYPNETRDSKFETMFFKPFMMLFGEMFKSELSDYAFETVDDCVPNSRIFLTPKNTAGRNVYNARDNEYSFLQDKYSDVTMVEETHPLFDVPYFKPTNLLPETSKLAVFGLIQLQALKDSFDTPKNSLTVEKTWFEKFEWRRAKYGIPSFENGSDGIESALFIPNDDDAQKGDFSRCPERYWVNSVFLMLYVLFAVVMILNLLVAMFATTYSRVRGDSSTIWKKQRYNLVIEYYNNPAKPITPPLILFLDIYWVIKYAVLRQIRKKNHLALREVNHPRVLGQHSLRLPPIFVNERDLYTKIFQALAVIESKAANEEDKSVSVEDLEGMIESLQVRIDCLREQEESAKDK